MKPAAAAKSDSPPDQHGDHKSKKLPATNLRLCDIVANEGQTQQLARTLSRILSSCEDDFKIQNFMSRLFHTCRPEGTPIPMIEPNYLIPAVRFDILKSIISHSRITISEIPKYTKDLGVEISAKFYKAILITLQENVGISLGALEIIHEVASNVVSTYVERKKSEDDGIDAAAWVKLLEGGAISPETALATLLEDLPRDDFQICSNGVPLSENKIDAGAVGKAIVEGGNKSMEADVVNYLGILPRRNLQTCWPIAGAAVDVETYSHEAPTPKNKDTEFGREMEERVLKLVREGKIEVTPHGFVPGVSVAGRLPPQSHGLIEIKTTSNMDGTVEIRPSISPVNATDVKVEERLAVEANSDSKVVDPVKDGTLPFVIVARAANAKVEPDGDLQLDATQIQDMAAQLVTYAHKSRVADSQQLVDRDMHDIGSLRKSDVITMLTKPAASQKDDDWDAEEAAVSSLVQQATTRESEEARKFGGGSAVYGNLYARGSIPRFNNAESALNVVPGENKIVVGEKNIAVGEMNIAVGEMKTSSAAAAKVAVPAAGSPSGFPAPGPPSGFPANFGRPAELSEEQKAAFDRMCMENTSRIVYPDSGDDRPRADPVRTQHPSGACGEKDSPAIPRSNASFVKFNQLTREGPAVPAAAGRQDGFPGVYPSYVNSKKPLYNHYQYGEPMQTPEGMRCGLVKSMASGAMSHLVDEDDREGAVDRQILKALSDSGAVVLTDDDERFVAGESRAKDVVRSGMMKSVMPRMGFVDHDEGAISRGAVRRQYLSDPEASISTDHDDPDCSDIIEDFAADEDTAKDELENSINASLESDVLAQQIAEKRVDELQNKMLVRVDKCREEMEKLQRQAAAQMAELLAKLDQELQAEEMEQTKNTTDLIISLKEDELAKELAKEEADTKAKRNKVISESRMKLLTKIGRLDSKVLSEKGLIKGGIESEDEVCCICITEPKTHATLPCGHRAYCKACVKEVRNCAICRAIVTSTKQIYL